MKTMESPRRLLSKRYRNGPDNEIINEDAQQSYTPVNKRKRKSKSSSQVDNHLNIDSKEQEQIIQATNDIENDIKESILISKNIKESSKPSNLAPWVSKTYSSGIDKQKFIKKIHGKNAIKYFQATDTDSQNVGETSSVYNEFTSQHKVYSDKSIKTDADVTTNCYAQREFDVYDANSVEKYNDSMNSHKTVQIVKSSKSNPQLQKFTEAGSNTVLVCAADLAVPSSSVIPIMTSANINPISQVHFNENQGQLVNKPTPSFNCPTNTIQNFYSSGNHASQIALQNFQSVVTHHNHLSTTSSVYTTSPCNISQVRPSSESHQTITSVLPILQDTSTQSFSQLQNLTETPSIQQTSILATNESQSTAFVERVNQNTSEISNLEFSSLDSSVNVSGTSVVSIPSTSSGQVTTSSLRVENWGTYLLQRLEVLLDKEAECDLILKFVSGESLKVHKVVISACTSLINESLIDDCHNDDCQEEITMHPDLEYIWVEPVIRFVYSGRLDVRGSPSEMTAIYGAAQRLKVTLLIRLMDRRFPYLTPTQRASPAKLPIWKRSPSKVVRQHRRETTSTGSYKMEEDLLSDNCEKQQTKLGDDVSSENGKNIVYGEDHSVYLLQTNSQKIALANAAVRRKRPAEEARPTRFELEEVEEDSDDIGTWTPRSSPPPPPLTNILATSPPLSNILPTSPNRSNETTNINGNKRVGMKDRRQTRKTCYSGAGSSSKYSSVSNENVNSKVVVPQSQDPFDLLTLASEQELGGINHNQGPVSNNENLSEYSISESKDTSAIRPQKKFTKLGIQDQWPNFTMCYSENKDCYKEKKIGEDDKNLDNKKEKIDRLSLSTECNDDNLTHNSKVSDSDLALNDSKNLLDKIRTHLLRNKNIESSENSPKKSILKKEQIIGTPVISKKRVSFPLDENNELINEVAIYSHAKEPAQSLLDVQKTSGSLRLTPQSSENTALKTNHSMRQKVLMNLSVNDTDATCYSSHSNDDKDGIAEDSENVTSVSQGDMSSHAKIISEVLKKYPQLVKDKKNIRLKILKKGNDKTLNGKVVKSKVQYLVLSDTDNSKSKNINRGTKNLTNCKLKETGNLSRNAHQNNSKQFNCPECTELSFPTYFTFKKHVTSEHKDKSTTILDSIESVPYACYTCFLNEPIEFSDYCSYQQHMKDVHSKSEARLCNVCGFRPGRKLELAYHHYTEHNIAPPRNINFPKCDLCDHVAMNDSALLKHRSQHSNADNYTCATCGVAFRSFGALQGHMQTKLCQNKPAVTYTCPHCPLTFARSYNLKAHLKANHRSISMALHNQVVPVATAETSAIKTGTCSLSGVNIEENDTSLKQVSVGSDVMATEVNLVCGSVINESVSQAGHHHQSSSEAEALNTVANSLAASLGLPEENINQYMFTAGNNMDKYDGSQNSGGALNIQLIDAANTTQMSGTHLGPGVGVAYSMGDQVASLCQEGAVYSQATVPSPTSGCGTTMGAAVFGSMGGMMPGGQIVSTNQLVGGQPLTGQIVATGQMVAVTAASVIATTTAAPQGWTYVTYHLPTAGQVQTTHIPNTNCDNQQLVAALTTGSNNNQVTTEMIQSQAHIDSNLITATPTINHEEQQLLSSNSKINEPQFSRDNGFNGPEVDLNRAHMIACINNDDSSSCPTEVNSGSTEPNNVNKNQGSLVHLANTVSQVTQQQQQQQKHHQQQQQNSEALGVYSQHFA